MIDIGTWGAILCIFSWFLFKWLFRVLAVASIGKLAASIKHNLLKKINSEDGDGA